MTNREKELIKILSDPVLWCKYELGVTPRWYQAEILRSPSKRIVLRCARRLGKCFDKNSKVMTEKGPVSFEELISRQEGLRLVTFDPENHELRLTDKYTVFFNGVKNIYLVKTKSGRENRVTVNHPFYTYSDKYKWKTVSELRRGDKILVPSSYEGILPTETMDQKKAFRLGQLSTRIPSKVFELEKEALISFLRGYLQKYLVEPNASQDALFYNFHSAEKSSQVQHLLLHIGINSIRYNEKLVLRDNDYISFMQIFNEEYKNNVVSIKQQTILDEIETIRPIGKRETYDLTVNDTGTVVVDDIISHNSYTIGMHMLWHAFTTKHATCLYVTPSQNQIAQQFQDINKLIAGSQGLKHSIKRNTKSPYYIELRNGSVVKGITAGTKSGQKGFGLRGQKATWLYVDEMDYLSDDDWDSIAPIYMEAPKRIGVTVASTPTGRRGVFYNLCFLPGTQVLMEDGSQQNIEMLIPGQRVITHKKRPRTIEKVFINHYDDDIYTIKTRRINFKVSCTKNHPFYIYRDGKYQWCEAQDLLKTDELLIPIADIHTENDYSDLELEFLGYCFSSGSILESNINTTYMLDDKYRKQGITLKVQSLDVAERIAKLVDLLYGIKRIQINKRTKHINIYDVDLAVEVDKLLSKSIPKEIIYSSTEDLKNFFKGYLSGASYINKECFFVVPYKDLAPVLIMLGRLDVYPRINIPRDTSSVEFRLGKTVLKEQLKDTISYDWDEYRVSRTYSKDKIIEDGYMRVQIGSIKRKSFSGFVYNLQVEEDESYTANMFAVHNCTDKKLGYEEFHYPIMVHPEWSAEMEEELKQVFSTEVAWEHEMLAEFGTEVTGVFDKEKLDASLQDYNYITAPDYPAPRMIGVDWDKYGAETQIVVVEYDRRVDSFRVINRVAIPRSQFTLDNGVEKIKELNAIYDPIKIYVDRGYGEYQIETLHKYGLQHPETGLAEKIRGVSFSETIEVRDPYTKLPIKKPFKPFMVDQFAIQLERDRIILSESDPDVWRDLVNFNIVRYSASGQPVFTNTNDHTVDALLLAIAAFVLETPEFGGTVSNIDVARTVSRANIVIPDPLRHIERSFQPKPENPQGLIKVPVGSKPKRGRSRGFRRTSSSSGPVRRRTW